MTAMCMTALIFSLATGNSTIPEDGAKTNDVRQLGTVRIDNHTGQVLFQDPADDGKSYRIDVAISKPWDAPAIKSTRIEVWLLARGGKALSINSQPPNGVLVEAGGSLGATADAIYFFDRSVEPSELTAVVVSIDGEPKVFKLTNSK